MIKKIVCIIISLILVGSFIACGKQPDTDKATKDQASPTEAIETPKEYNDGIIGENKSYKNKSDLKGDIFDVEGEAEGFVAKEEAKAIAEIGIDYNDVQAEPGMLTAGEIKDIKDLSAWKSLFEGEFKKYRSIRELYSNNIIPVSIKSGESPVCNQKVELYNGETVIWSSVTDINGKASLFYTDDLKDKLNQLKIKVGNKEQTYDGSESVSIDVEGSEYVKELDLMLLVDTTGSMGDELNFLQEELADMINRISQSDQVFSIRISVNFYRDEGDEYVVKYYDFRDDVKDCVKILKEQNASGGGDYPEAVHEALKNIYEQHNWRKNATKLCFLVLDAPPHAEEDIQGINSIINNHIKTLSEMGVRIIPIASSGVNKETEYILRSFAIMTGGTYVFLTNDSGIGYDHIAPSTQDYDVELLNECMVRIVSEYCGLEYKSEKTFEKPTTPIYENGEQQ